MDELGIKWIRNIKGFSYRWNGKERTYIPDFYLPELDLYIEIKGYKKKIDEAKWECFPYELRVLDSQKFNQLIL